MRKTTRGGKWGLKGHGKGEEEDSDCEYVDAEDGDENMWTKGKGKGRGKKGKSTGNQYKETKKVAASGLITYGYLLMTK